MIKKLLETSLGPWDQTFFDVGGRRLNDEEVVELLNKECNPYATKDNGGVIVYFSQEEFEKIKGDNNIQ